MSRNKLVEIIDKFERELQDDEWCEGDLRRVLAAALAYACRRCSGTHRLGWSDLRAEWVICPDCAEYRRIADGEG